MGKNNTPSALGVTTSTAEALASWQVSGHVPSDAEPVNNQGLVSAWWFDARFATAKRLDLAMHRHRVVNKVLCHGCDRCHLRSEPTWWLPFGFVPGPLNHIQSRKR